MDWQTHRPIAPVGYPAAPIRVAGSRGRRRRTLPVSASITDAEVPRQLPVRIGALPRSPDVAVGLDLLDELVHEVVFRQVVIESNGIISVPRQDSPKVGLVGLLLDQLLDMVFDVVDLH